MVDTPERLAPHDRLQLAVAIRARMRNTLPPDSEVIEAFWSRRDIYTDAQLRGIADAHGVTL